MFLRRRRLGIEERLRRVENVVLALVGKVKKMAEGHEQSFRTLQDGMTQAGGDLRRSFENLVQAHDSGDAGRFEAAAQEHSDFINSLQNMGTSGNTATRAGQSPSGTGGASTGDLPQGRNQNHENRFNASGPTSQPQAGDENRNTGVAGRAGRASESKPEDNAQPSSGAKDDGERDVVVKGRDMPD